MKKSGTVVLMLILLIITCMAAPGHTAEREEGECRYEPVIDFIFEPPFAGSMQFYNGSHYPGLPAASEKLLGFLDEYGVGTEDTDYYQDNCLLFIDAAEHELENIVPATNTVHTGTTLNTMKYFTYYSGYGPSYHVDITISGYPANYYFTEYGVTFEWDA